MKYLKQFEHFERVEPDTIHDKLVETLYNRIINDNKNINGFEVHFDNVVGAINWSSKKCILYATPYWNGELYLPFDIYAADNDIDNDYTKIELKELKNEKDVVDLLDQYYQKIAEITEDLNDRMEFVKILPKILEYTPIEINTKIFLTNGDVDFVTTIVEFKYNNIICADSKWWRIEYVKSKSVAKMLHIIKKNYPEYFSMDIYNI